MLELDGLALRQGDFTLRADWPLEEGSRLALIGPSGAGKSTLLAGIAGFLAPQQGRVLWQGRDMAGLAPGKRPVAMLFQDGNLFPHLTVSRNVSLGIGPGRLSASDQARVNTALDRVGLGGLGGRHPAELSGGQQGRVALARVLVMRRPVLLLDEPFSALGPALRAEMLDLVRGLCHDTGATLIMVSHAPEDTMRIAGLTSVVADGVAGVPVGTAELFADPPEVLRDYLG